MNAKSKETLQALYKLVPQLECRGHCAASCGPIPLGEAEFQQVMEASGGMATYERPELATLAGAAHVLARGAVCPLLSLYGKCTVYEQRPLICRLWGNVETMMCPWGCEPKKYLSHNAGLKLQRIAHDLPAHEPKG